MGRKKHAFPRPTIHKPSGQERIRITLPDGKKRDVYLGPAGSAEARQNYAAELKKWELGDFEPPADGGSVGELVAKWLVAAEKRYQKNGRSTGSYERFVRSAKPLIELFEDLPVDDFTPQKLVAVRNKMIAEIGHFRTNPETRAREWIPAARVTVNQRIAVIRNAFAWGVANGLVKSATWTGLAVITPLRPNETDARETEAIASASPEDIERILAVLDERNPVGADMLRIQIRTGMRSTELCVMRPCDIKRDFPDGIWEYEPSEHKTEHHGKARVIPLGPACQKILIHYLNECGPTDYLFSPEKAVALQKRIQRERNPRPVRGPQKGRKDDPKTKPGKRYRRDSYRNMIKRAAARAGVTANVFPHQFRHTAATAIDRRYGKDAARNILGHSETKTTDRYVDYNREQAHAVAKEIG